MIRNLLLTHQQMSEKYAELDKKNFQYPYFYKILKDNQILFFVGPHHTFKRDHQIDKLDEYWSEFISETKKNNCAVMIEGGIRPIETSPDLALQKHGEPGHIAFLASREGIPVYSPEPDERLEILELLKNFSKEEIEYYRFARMVLQWNKLSPKPDFNKYIQLGHLDKDKAKLGWDDFDFSVTNLIGIHNKKYDHLFDSEKCERCVYNSSNPSSNPVSDASGIIRDENIVSETKRFWDEGYSLFIVYGSGHAIVCESALKKLLT